MTEALEGRDAQPDLRLSTRTDDPPAEHGLTITASGGRYWGACLCGWKSFSQSNVSMALRFGEHLLATNSGVPGVL